MRKLALSFIFVVVVLVGGAVFAGALLWARMTELYKGYSTTEQIVDIPRGATSADIRRRLVDAGVVHDEVVFRAAVLWTGQSKSLKAGEYQFERPMSAIAVIEKLARGEVYVHKITFPEGLTIRDMAGIYESRGFGPAAQFIEAARDPSRIKDWDPQADDLEGYLFPETYSVARGGGAAQLVTMMVDRFRATVADDFPARARAQGLTVRQAMSLASLIEKETAQADERPLVAAVYRNRAKIGMAMQADPTIVYALQKAGRYDGNIRRADLEIASPYNTYRYPGLPPGPIASPGKGSIEAALAPAGVPYLYFVSRNDGTHVFAETLAQHNANVQRFQVQYFRDKRAEDRRQAQREKVEGRR